MGLALAVDLERNQQQQDLALLTQVLEPQRTPALEEVINYINLSTPNTTNHVQGTNY